MSASSVNKIVASVIASGSFANEQATQLSDAVGNNLTSRENDALMQLKSAIQSGSVKAESNVSSRIDQMADRGSPLVNAREVALPILLAPAIVGVWAENGLGTAIGIAATLLLSPITLPIAAVVGASIALKN